MVIEDLNVRGMVRNRKLAKAVSDSAMSAFLAKLTYRPMVRRGGQKGVPLVPVLETVRTVRCDQRSPHTGDRVFRCECGYECERDLNAAINLRDYDAASLAESPPEAVSPPAAAAEAREPRKPRTVFLHRPAA